MNTTSITHNDKSQVISITTVENIDDLSLIIIGVIVVIKITLSNGATTTFETDALGENLSIISHERVIDKKTAKITINYDKIKNDQKQLEEKDNEEFSQPPIVKNYFKKNPAKNLILSDGFQIIETDFSFTRLLLENPTYKLFVRDNSMAEYLDGNVQRIKINGNYLNKLVTKKTQVTIENGSIQLAYKRFIIDTGATFNYLNVPEDIISTSKKKNFGAFKSSIAGFIGYVYLVKAQVVVDLDIITTIFAIGSHVDVLGLPFLSESNMILVFNKAKLRRFEFYENPYVSNYLILEDFLENTNDENEKEGTLIINDVDIKNE